MGRWDMILCVACGLSLTAVSRSSAGQEPLFRAELAYRTPGSGPAPNFSPKGTQVLLMDLAPAAVIPAGALRPAKSGVIRIGPSPTSWIPVLATADAEHAKDLCRLYLDRNRNGSFADDGPAVSAKPTQNEKTQAWWSSFNKIELIIPYGSGSAGDPAEPYMVNFWIVREGEEAPGMLRYSVASWRSGAVKVNGVEGLVAAMDADNNAVFDKNDQWSVLEAVAPDAARRVLSYSEARPMGRLMFLEAGGKELVLEFRSITPDGKTIAFALVDRPVTKAMDRAPDDTLAAERNRPRARTPFVWSHGNLESSMKQAKSEKKMVIVDFETSWCGPCKTMDDWIWTDAEVAAILNADFVGVKLDGDVEKELVRKFAVNGYPAVILLDDEGKEIRRFLGYKSSKEVLECLRSLRQHSDDAEEIGERVSCPQRLE